MCKSSNTTTTIQQPEIPDWLQTAFQGVVEKAGQVAQIPFNPATFRNVAGFSGDQNAAFQQARDMVGNWQPYLNTAADYATTAGSTIAPTAINQYMNPFQQNVIDATLANIQQNNALQQQQLQGNAALQGALGGDRVKVAQAELARQQGLATNQTLANLNAQNYNQALAAAQADRTAAGNAASQFGSLANQISALGAGDYSRLLAQGGLQQGLAQQMLDTASANAAMQSQYPFAVTGWEQGIYTGAAPSFTGYTSSATQPAPNPVNSLLGLGAMGLGAFLSDERAKEDIEPVGELYDGTTVYKYKMVGDPRTQIGVMAQEVETRTPEAVHEVGGLKMVNYDTATKKSEGLAARKGYAEGGWVFPGNLVLGGRGRSSQEGAPPYRVNSYVPATGSQLLGAVQQPPLAKPPPPPKQRDEDQDDPVKMFNDARKAAQGLNAGLGQIVGKLDTTQGPGGWSTSVQPTMAGLGNYLGNFLRSTGGRVGYAEGGEVSNIPSGISPALMAAYLPAGAAFSMLGGGYGALVDTDSLLSGGQSSTGSGFTHVATGILPQGYTPHPTVPLPSGSNGGGSGGGGGGKVWHPGSPYEHYAAGGRVSRRLYQGGAVVNEQPAQQTPTEAPQAGLASQPGMMPQGMPMAAPVPPMGLGMPMGGGMMPPMGMGAPMPMGGAPGGSMPALPPPGGMQAPMPPPQPQGGGGLGQPIRIPPKTAPYGRKVLEKQLAREKGLGDRPGYQSGGVVDGYYDPEEDVWKVAQPGAESSTAQPDSMWQRAKSGEYSWLAEPLITAGAAMMASQSPFVGPAIGQGALAGIKQYRTAQEAEALERRAREQMAEQKRMNDLRAKEMMLRMQELEDPMLPYERRVQVLERFGVDPNSKEGQVYILTGELPKSLTGGAKVGMQAIWGEDEHGNKVLLQLSDTGEAVRTKLPEGVRPTDQLLKVDRGTDIAFVDRRTGEVVGTQPKNIEEAERLKERGSEIGKGEGRMASPEAKAKKIEAETHLANAVHNLDRLAAEAKAIRDNPSLWRATGLMNELWSVPGGEAANIDAAMTTLKSQTGFGVLQAMRDASKSGGALGQVSNIENELLQNNLAALSQSQSTEAFKKNLDKIIAYTDGAKARLTSAFRETYGQEFDPNKYAPGKFQGRLSDRTVDNVDDIPEGAKVRDNETGRILIKRNGRLEPAE